MEETENEIEKGNDYQSGKEDGYKYGECAPSLVCDLADINKDAPEYMFGLAEGVQMQRMEQERLAYFESRREARENKREVKLNR